MKAELDSWFNWRYVERPDRHMANAKPTPPQGKHRFWPFREDLDPYRIFQHQSGHYPLHVVRVSYMTQTSRARFEGAVRGPERLTCPRVVAPGFAPELAKHRGEVFGGVKRRHRTAQCVGDSRYVANRHKAAYTVTSVQLPLLLPPVRIHSTYGENRRYLTTVIVCMRTAPSAVRRSR